MDKVFSGALWDSGEHPEAREKFISSQQRASKYLEEAKHNHQFDLNRWSLGKSKQEQRYRQWCLDNCLFLSPLNDVTNLSIAARDPFHLPSHVYPMSDKPRFPNYYNVIKQEYIAARVMLFEATDNMDKKHFSDNDNLLLNGYDGCQFGYRTEQIKIAYRLGYSIFDKIAMFLNDYFSLKSDPESVNFRKVWGNKKGKLYPCFLNSENWLLRGLYYLSKDFFDDQFKNSSLPDATDLLKLRNYIEHRFISLSEYDNLEQTTDNHLYIEKKDFSRKTLKILRMGREALIYLSLAMKHEETIREKHDQQCMGRMLLPPATPL